MNLQSQVQAQFKRWLSLQGDPELARRTFLFNIQAEKSEEESFDKAVQMLLDRQILCLSKKLPLGTRVLWILKAGPELK